MPRWKTLLRYDLPLHFVLLLTNWLPDNVVFLRLRGALARLFLGKCGKDLRLGRNITFYNPSKIEFGDHVYAAYGCIFLAGEEIISLGGEVFLGPYCVFASDNHTRKNGSFRYGSTQSAPIHVGSGSWLGARVTVTAGSVIGQGALVGAGSVVTSKIPDNVLAGGVPAKVIKPLTE